MDWHYLIMREWWIYVSVIVRSDWSPCWSFCTNIIYFLWKCSHVFKNIGWLSVMWGPIFKGLKITWWQFSIFGNTSFTHTLMLPLWDSLMLDFVLEPQQCLYASTWIETARLPWGQQVLYQRWIWGICCVKVTMYAIKEIHPGLL